MRSAQALVALGALSTLAVLSLAGCSSEDTGGMRRGPGGSMGSGAGPGTEGSTPASVACPATVAAPTAVSTVDTDATDVHVIPDAIIYRSGLKIVRVESRTLARSELYTSPNVVHSYADSTVLVTIESPNPPNAVLRIQAPGPTTGNTPDPITVEPDGWSAGGTYVFGSDADNLYILADVDNDGDTLYRVSKTDPNNRSVLAKLQAPLGDPQLVGTDVWFVREQKRVYRVGAQSQDATPTEVFGVSASDCKLAVGGQHAFCSTGTLLEQRDLTGANPLTVLDSQKGAGVSLLGAATFAADKVYVRSLPATPTDNLKHGIRAIKADGTASPDAFIACGRETINSVTVSDTSVVWAEQGKGVFQAPR